MLPRPESQVKVRFSSDIVRWWCIYERYLFHHILIPCICKKRTIFLIIIFIVVVFCLTLDYVDTTILYCNNIGKGKALNAIAAASGRDPASIVKSVEEAEKAAKLEQEKAAKHEEEEEAKRIEEEQAKQKAKEEVTTSQIFNKLSPQQQYQYECFRRCGFASTPIEKFVAKTLVEEANRRYLVRRGTKVGLGRMQSGDNGSSGYSDDGINNDVANNTDTSDNKKRRKYSTKYLLKEESKRRRIAIDQPPPYILKGNVSSGNGSSGSLSSGVIPPLSNLVVPNSASEIVAVVSAMAKCYAQRLVSAAKRVADAEEEEKKIQGTSTVVEDAPQKPLEPHHFLEAHRHRQRAGLDPGFWMANPEHKGTNGFNKGATGMVEAAALGTIDRERINYLAALDAQEDFDKKSQEITEQKKDEMNDDKMDVGSEEAEKEASSAGAVST